MADALDVIVIAEYPQLSLLAWSFRKDHTMTGPEAYSLYEANWRFVEEGELLDHERALIERLIATYGQGLLNA
jgi:hypothetical protein